MKVYSYDLPSHVQDCFIDKKFEIFGKFYFKAGKSRKFVLNVNCLIKKLLIKISIIHDF